MLVGLLALFTGTAWLVAQPDILAYSPYTPDAVAVTHLFVLGWLCSVVMGAVYQLVPVALETKLYSERLAHWQFALHLVGLAGMVFLFRAWNMKGVGYFGTVLTIGVVLFAYNIARTLGRVPKWNVIATAVASALTWLLLTVTAGLLLVDAQRGFAPLLQFNPIAAMHAHAHLGAVGFFTMLIVGVSYKLVPMFTLSEVQNHRRAAWSVTLLSAGLAGLFAGILLQQPWKLAFAFVIIVALALYGWELQAILRARKRRALDWGITYFLTAVAMLLPLSALAVVLTWPGLPATEFTGRLESAYGVLGFIGFVSFAIIGMLYKIIPFLIWFGTYSKHVGRARVPALAEMYSARLQATGYWTFLVGLLATVTAMLLASAAGIRLGCGLLAMSLAVLAVNVGKILSHYLYPRLVPLNVNKASNRTGI
jgi:cbb3-type cytochrome oxidase subunit 1